MAAEVWEAALSTSWKNPPVWVHGDISAGNLLVRNGKLSGYIYYSCTNAKKICKRVYVKEEELVKTLSKYLDQIALS